MKQVRDPLASSGDTDYASMSELYRRYATALFAYICLRVPSQEDAEDILLETFLSALESQVFADLSEEKQRAWLYSTIRNKIVDRYRHAVRRPSVALEQCAELLYLDEEHEPEQATLRREEYEQLQARVRRLPRLQQEVLWLRFANGLRCHEIASVLGKREGAIRSMLSRTLNFLRSIYNEQRRDQEL